MINVENFYEKNANIADLIEKENPIELIRSFHAYFDKIKVIPEIKSDENLKERKRYLSNENVEIIINVIQYLGDDFPKEVIRLVASLEFWVHHKICQQYNLFKFLVDHMEDIQDLNEENVWDLLNYAYLNNQELTFGKKLYSSVGTKGIGYKGFINDLYSNKDVTNGNFNIHYRLEMLTNNYDLTKIGRKLGVQEQTLHQLQIASENLNSVKQTVEEKYCKMSSDYMEAEKNYKTSLKRFVEELNKVFSKQYSGFYIHFTTFFKTPTDVFTDFFVCVYKSVTLTDNYNQVVQMIKETIRSFNDIESTLFNYDVMQERMAKARLELKERFQNFGVPLFN